MKTRMLFLIISLLGMANLMCLASVRDYDQDHSFTKTEPQREQLAGKYVPTSETISFIIDEGQYQLNDISISLYPDGNFEMQNMPDWWLPNDAGYGKPDGFLDSGIGRWTVSQDNLSGLWQLTLAFESGIFNGVHETFTISLDLNGEQPPYSIWIYVGNPDRGRVMIFEQEVRNP